MKKVYGIIIENTLQKTIYVQAAGLEEALDKADNLILQNNFSFAEDDSIGVSSIETGEDYTLEEWETANSDVITID